MAEGGHFLKIETEHILEICLELFEVFIPKWTPSKGRICKLTSPPLLWPKNGILNTAWQTGIILTILRGATAMQHPFVSVAGCLHPLRANCRNESPVAVSYQWPLECGRHGRIWITLQAGPDDLTLLPACTLHLYLCNATLFFMAAYFSTRKDNNRYCKWADSDRSAKVIVQWKEHSRPGKTAGVSTVLPTPELIQTPP